MIDRELVTRKIVLISGDLEELRKFDSAGLEACLADLPGYLQAVVSFIG